MICSIVIPVCNSAAVLPETLRALASQAQSVRNWDIQIIISDDGSNDSTLRVAQAAALPTAWERRIVAGPHRGAGAARNRGLAAAAGDAVLFLGADIRLRPYALAAHLHFHETHPAPTAAALGFVMWDPTLHPSPLMEWMMHGGSQNDYDNLLGSPQADPRHFFYGANLSIKRAVLAGQPFQEIFTSYGWEDFELGRRLAARGLLLHVLPTATAVHHHRYSAAAICRRQYAVGYNLVRYQRLHPHVSLLPKVSFALRLKYLLAWYSGGGLLLRLLAATAGQRWSLPYLFERLTTLYFWRGVWRALSETKQAAAGAGYNSRGS